MLSLDFNISAVERDTGLSKDVLRVWERRYGFPTPERDVNGERRYPADQVERLRLIKRLMDQGHRPGKLIPLAAAELAALMPRRGPPKVEEGGAEAPEDWRALLELIRQHDAPAYLRAMQQRLSRQGLQRFVLDTVAPLGYRVGEAWNEGSLQVFEEHLFTELTKRLLRQAIAALPEGRLGPRVLLTTVPDEQHGLGLLMLEALLSLEGAACVPLGTQMPVLEIISAVSAHRADVLALSFSNAFPYRRIPDLLRQLREALPAGVEIWAGGGGMARVAPLDGIRHSSSLAEGLAALADWRLRARTGGDT